MKNLFWILSGAFSATFFSLSALAITTDIEQELKNAEANARSYASNLSGTVTSLYCTTPSKGRSKCAIVITKNNVDQEVRVKCPTSPNQSCTKNN